MSPGQGGQIPGPTFATAQRTLVASSADIPAVAAQPATGQRMTIGPVVGNGPVVGFGTIQDNAGPIDIITVDSHGVVTTLFPQFNTEATGGFRSYDGAVYVPAFDPRSDSIASIATNAGGAWRVVPVSVAGLPPASHLFMAHITSPTDWSACGSRDITEDEGRESGNNPANTSAAIVWSSSDQGATWTEALADLDLTSGYNRFTEFRVSDAVRVQGSEHFDSHYELVGSEWVQRDGPAPALPPSTAAKVLARDGDRVLYLTANGDVHDSQSGVLDSVSQPFGRWSGALDEGRVWLCDEGSIYVLPT